MRKETFEMVRELIDRLNGWSKILIVATPIITGGLIGYGKLQGKIEELDKHKAETKEVSQIQESILYMKDDVKEMKRDIKELLKK